MSRKLTVALLVAIVVLLVAIVALLSTQINQTNQQSISQTSQQQTAAFATSQKEIANKCERDNPSMNNLGTLDLTPLIKCLRDNGYVLPTQSLATKGPND